jgi:hypothetical protein
MTAARQQLELELLHNVEFARALYEGLCREYVRDRERAAAAALAATEDARLLYDRCRQMHDAMQLALDEYRAELRRFTRLVIDRVPPGPHEVLP